MERKLKIAHAGGVVNQELNHDLKILIPVSAGLIIFMPEIVKVITIVLDSVYLAKMAYDYVYYKQISS